MLMVKKYDQENALTYSKKEYSEGFQAVSEINAESVDAAWSIGIPAEYMPDTSAVKFNVDTYREDFKKIMVPALENAIKDNKLASNCGASFRSEYSDVSSRQKMLDIYADNVLNTVVYKVACQVMTANNSWVAQVITAYRQYCKNISLQNSGINAFLNYIYLTHAFEGEAKDEIEKFLDAMTAQAGFYGQFALTCAGQDSLQTAAAKEQLVTDFVNTVLSLYNRKTKAVVGKDNYCYITGTVLEEDYLYLHSTLDVQIIVTYYLLRPDTYTYDGCDATPWRVTVPSIADSVYMPIIYNYYRKFPQGTNSFGEYLHKYGAQRDASNKTYMTSYRGTETFAFSEGIRMQAKELIAGGEYFNDNGWHQINIGNQSSVKDKYYEVHDKVMGDWFDSSNGKPSINTIIAARAFYGESYWAWNIDVAFSFASEGVSQSLYRLNSNNDVRVDFSRTVNVLKSTPCHDLNGDDVSDPENPFFAFDEASITPGVSDQIGPSYENTSRDITEVLLEGDSFPYTGLPIEPAVTVFASGDVVPEDGYTVTYIDNIESGDSAVVRVEGKGDYSGIISTHFTITEDASPVSGIRESSSGGCEAMSGVGIALGLVFAARKFRRR